ncbi:MAG: hypothetical protein IKF70_06735 [Firmicutes bacterium]|nr:hypothetical protein [Bacillota bacterium]
MDYESIIKDITAGLTGDWQADIQYLQIKMDEYKDHERGPEIMRELGRLAYEALPEDQKAQLADAMQHDQGQIQAVLDEADACLGRGDIPGALEVMKTAVDAVKAFELVPEDKVSIYLDLSEPFEEVLYRFRLEPEKDLRPAAIRAGEIYYRYGSLLIDAGDFDGAREALETACTWNPMNAEYRFEYLESLKASGMLQEFFDGTKAFIPNCFRPWTFARAYRNLAFWYTEQKRWRDASICLDISEKYDPDNEILRAERSYISEMNGGEPPAADMVGRELFLAAENLPERPDHVILELADEIGEHYYNTKDWNTAEYFYTIAADLFPEEAGTAALRLIEMRAGREPVN